MKTPLCMLMWLTVGAVALGDDIVWKGFIQQGDHLEKQRALHQAQDQYTRALNIAKAEFEADDDRLAFSMMKLANVYLAHRQEAKAVPLYKDAIRIFDADPHSGNFANAAYCWQRLGTYYTQMNDFTNAQSALKKSVAVYEKLEGEAGINVGRGWHALGLLYAKQSKITLAFEAQEQAMVILEKQTTYDATLPFTYMALAALYRRGNETDHAVKYFNAAVTFIEKNAGPKHPDLIPILKEFASLQRVLGKQPLANSMDARAKQIAKDMAL